MKNSISKHTLNKCMNRIMNKCDEQGTRSLGAEEIHLACLEARDVMTADDEEIEQAKEEGIFVHPAQTFEKITGTDHVTGVDFMNVKSFTFTKQAVAAVATQPAVPDPA